jgi:hypothetical protein
MGKLFFSKSLAASGLALFVAMALCRCSGALESAVEDAAEATTQQTEMAMLLQSSVSTATAAVEAIEEESGEDGSTAQAELTGGTRDCLTDGSVTVTPDSGLIEFENCTASVADYTLVSDGNVGVTFTGELEAEVTADITVDFTTAAGHEYEYVQGGSLAVTLTETDAAVSFTDFDGAITSDGVEYDYAVDGDLAYEFESNTVTGEVTVSNGDVTLTCEFTDFDVQNADSDDWIDACLF